MAKHSCWDRPAFRRGVRRNSCSHGAAVFALAALGTLAGASAARCGGDLDLLCVDFESNATFDGFTFGKNAKVVRNKGHSSNSSLYFYSCGGDSSCWEEGFMTYGRAVPTKHYGRVFYNLEASNTGGNPYTHTTFVQAAGRNPQIVDTVRTADGREDYNLAWADEFGKSSQYSYRVELGRWVCVEWQFDSGAGTFALWVDGRPVAGPTGPLPRAVPAVFPK